MTTLYNGKYVKLIENSDTWFDDTQCYSNFIKSKKQLKKIKKQKKNKTCNNYKKVSNKNKLSEILFNRLVILAGVVFKISSYS